MPAQGRVRMETRKLGNSDLKTTPVGYGAWAIGGGGWEFAWGPQDDGDSIAAIHRALELGVNWIDTRPSMGWDTPRRLSLARSRSGVGRVPMSSRNVFWRGMKREKSTRSSAPVPFAVSVMTAFEGCRLKQSISTRFTGRRPT